MHSEDTEGRLQSVGFKPTGPRARILATIEEQGGNHLTAGEIYRRLADAGPVVSIATVYRVLGQFEDAGLVVRHRFEGGMSVYEPAAAEHHDHLRCLKCGHVEEFRDPVIEQRQEAVAGGAGFLLLNHTLTLYGLCAVCSAPETRD